MYIHIDVARKACALCSFCRCGTRSWHRLTVGSTSFVGSGTQLTSWRHGQVTKEWPHASKRTPSDSFPPGSASSTRCLGGGRLANKELKELGVPAPVLSPTGGPQEFIIVSC
jgi:hypothetical protein